MLKHIRTTKNKITVFLFAAAFVLCFSSIGLASNNSNKNDSLIVSPVNIPTARSSYGVSPGTLDMISNDIINALNKYAGANVPDVNTTNDLINSYGLSNEYRDFLRGYKDNRVIDHKVCSKLYNKMGVGKILLVSGGYDVQNMFLASSKSEKFSQISSMTLPFTRILSKDLIFWSLPSIGGKIYSSVKNEGPITPCYKLNIDLALVDSDTGILLWNKSFVQNLPASDFSTTYGSFGENIISTEKLKNFSDKIARRTSYSVYMAINQTEYTSVSSSIVPSEPFKKNKTNLNSSQKKNLSTRDGNLTKDGQPSSSNSKYLEEKRKESYRNWVKERTKK